MKLLFAIVANGKIVATYLNDAGETLHADLPVNAQSTALQSAVEAAVGQPLRGVQIFTEHAGEKSASLIEGLYAEVVDGVSSKLISTTNPEGAPVEGTEALQAANVALRGVVEAGLAAL